MSSPHVAAEPAQPDLAIQVLVVAPAWPIEDALVLEIDGRAFAIPEAGGNGIAEVRGPAPSSLIRVITASCRVILAFDSAPGTGHVIRIADDAAVEVEHRREILELGPALIERAPVDCAEASTGNWPLAEILLGGLIAVGVLLLLMLVAFRRSSSTG